MLKSIDPGIQLKRTKKVKPAFTLSTPCFVQSMEKHTEGGDRDNVIYVLSKLEKFNPFGSRSDML